MLPGCFLLIGLAIFAFFVALIALTFKNLPKVAAIVVGSIEIVLFLVFLWVFILPMPWVISNMFSG